MWINHSLCEIHLFSFKSINRNHCFKMWSFAIDAAVWRQGNPTDPQFLLITVSLADSAPFLQLRNMEQTSKAWNSPWWGLNPKSISGKQADESAAPRWPLPLSRRARDQPAGGLGAGPSRWPRRRLGPRSPRNEVDSATLAFPLPHLNWSCSDVHLWNSVVKSWKVSEWKTILSNPCSCQGAPS